MSDSHDDIDPQAIPTLTKIVVPGHVKQLPLDGVEEPETTASSAPSPAEEIPAEATPDAELWSPATGFENLPDGETDAASLDDEIARITEELSGSQDTFSGPASGAGWDERSIETLVDKVLQRHTAALREELIALVRRELARQTPPAE